MKKTPRNTVNNMEEIKMVKYIVEAPEPKNGQKVSSGGIRENGKLASQFKNPVPYKEPTWQEFGEPLLRSGLHKLGSVIVSKIEAPTTRTVQPLSSPESEIIDVEADEIETIYDDDKIINFQNRKII